MLLDYYKKLLGDIPSFLKKYLKCSSLKRLKKVGYFCGMDYASTPCFSHVIDYMNKDYANQETTEEYTGKILENDSYLLECLKRDSILLDDIIDFKRYSIVDNQRPRVCADRLDGVILTGISWTKNVDEAFIRDVIFDMRIDHGEIGFTSKRLVKKIVKVSNSIDIMCHSKEDHYMMELLADITRYAISKEYISYDDLYVLNEDEIFKIFKSKKDKTLNYMIQLFQNIKLCELPPVEVPSSVKIRDLKPLVRGERYEG